MSRRGSALKCPVVAVRRPHNASGVKRKGASLQSRNHQGGSYKLPTIVTAHGSLSHDSRFSEVSTGSILSWSQCCALPRYSVGILGRQIIDVKRICNAVMISFMRSTHTISSGKFAQDGQTIRPSVNASPRTDAFPNLRLASYFLTGVVDSSLFPLCSI